jgi:hypothetical protein
MNGVLDGDNQDLLGDLLVGVELVLGDGVDVEVVGLHRHIRNIQQALLHSCSEH